MPKPERPPAFQFYVDDFASDGKVEAMTTKAVGAYILLLCKAWREEPPGSIPNTDAVLARWARLTPEEWAECREMVLAAFSLGNDGRWHQQRMRREYEKSQSFKKQRAASAIKAAQARWHKPSIENEIDASRIRHASVTHPSRIRHAESSSSSSPSSAKEEEKNSARASWLGDAQDLLTNLYGGVWASEAQRLYTRNETNSTPGTAKRTDGRQNHTRFAGHAGGREAVHSRERVAASAIPGEFVFVLDRQSKSGDKWKLYETIQH